LAAFSYLALLRLAVDPEGITLFKTPDTRRAYRRSVLLAVELFDLLRAVVDENLRVRQTEITDARNFIRKKAHGVASLDLLIPL
jgi:hypothetical protein